MVTTTIALAPDLHQRLAIAAVEERAALTVLAREAIAEWLDRRDARTKRPGRR
jgi:predicted transcriptional regulator